MMVLPRRSLAAALVLGATAMGAQPAAAQSLFDVLFGRPVDRAPVYAPTYHPYAPEFDRAPVRRRPKVVRAAPPVVQMPAKPKPIGQVTNPLPELLADNTLRRGDIVVFPDGARVFNGDHGTRHTLADFEPVSQAASLVPAATRKLVSTMKPSVNMAWSTDKPAAQNKLAVNTRDVETTGSVRPARR